MRNTLLNSSALEVPPPGGDTGWGRLIGASCALAAAELAQQLDGPLLVLAEDPRHADQLEAEIRFFAGIDLPVEHFVEWETLPWDSFSPHLDIISQRLSVLASLPSMRKGVVIAKGGFMKQGPRPVDEVARRSGARGGGRGLNRRLGAPRRGRRSTRWSI